jgi:hypothetical protein
LGQRAAKCSKEAEKGTETMELRYTRDYPDVSKNLPAFKPTAYKEPT